jgi:hypothetical protein
MCFAVLTLSISFLPAQQSIDSSAARSAKGKLTLEGYVDGYFAFDFNQPVPFDRPYFVSHSRHNEFNINLAYISLKYNSGMVRAVVTPGMGTYMNANYSAERITLQHLVEANVGVRLFKNREIWLDLGVLPSPFTYENAISLDQIAYTRSFAAENVPYYQTGARLTLPLSLKTTLYLYYLNGWQVIQDFNSPLSAATQLEVKPNSKWTFDWNTYYGNESSPGAPTNRMRYFTDVYTTYSAGKWSFSADAYLGWQQRRETDGIKAYNWWQANVAAKYAVNDQHAFFVRAEYFSDPNKIMLTPNTGADKFRVFGGTFGYTHSFTDQVALRVEGRYFVSPDHIYERNHQTTGNDFLMTCGLTARIN